jgi:hypothetical protein
MSGFRRRWPLTGSPLSSALARWTQPSGVKSVQRNTITITGATSNTATITSVDVSNARLRWLSETISNTADTGIKSLVRLALTNATTVTATVNTSPGADSTIVSFEVIEYFPGVIKSVQRGTIALAAVAGNTASINPVNTAKTELDFLGVNIDGSVNLVNTVRLVLTSATVVTATMGTAEGNTTVGYQVVEWY